MCHSVEMIEMNKAYADCKYIFVIIFTDLFKKVHIVVELWFNCKGVKKIQ